MNYACVIAFSAICSLATSFVDGPNQSPYHKLVTEDNGSADNHKQSINAGWVPNVGTDQGESSPTREEDTPLQASLRTLYNGELGKVLQMNGQEVEVDFTPELIKKAGYEDKNYLVMISASWCRPCKRMYPLMNKLRKEGYIIYVFDTTKKEFRNYRALYNVRAYPTFLIYDNKKEVKRSVGVTKEKWFKDNLKTLKEQNDEEKKPEPKPDEDPYDGGL